MKIKICIVSLLIIFLCENVAKAEEFHDIIKTQEDALGITNFIDESNKYTSDFFSAADIEAFFKEAISGKVDNKKIWTAIIGVFGKEVKNTLTVFSSILLIIVINSILSSVTEGLENKSISQIAFYVQYILIVTIILTNFSDIIDSVKTSINQITDFMNMLIPVMMTLIISSGCVTTATVIQPAMVFLITLISNFVNNVAIPLILVSTSLGIVSQVSDKVQIGKLAKRLKSSTIWIMAMILTIFVTVISVNGNMSKNVDAVASKTAKTAVSNLIPIVGKILGDAMDSVLGCGNILKGAIGTLGTIVTIALAIRPAIKLFLLMSIYYLGAAICEPLADKRIIGLLDHMGDTFKVLFAITCSVSVMVIIGITLTVNITNTSVTA